MKQNKLTSSRQSRKKKHRRRLRCIQNGHVTQKTAKNCRMESWEDCIILLWLGTIYPGCQRLFMGCFRFRSSLKKCRSPVDKRSSPMHARQNLWYTQGRVYFTRRQKQENHGEPMVTVNGDLIPNSKEKIYRPKIDRRLTVNWNNNTKKSLSIW